MQVLMNLFRSRLVRLPIVAIGSLAWLTISNHCLIATMEGAARMPMPRCHGASPANPSPANHDQKGSVVCCKVLRATLLTSAKSVVALDEFLFAPHKYFVCIVVVPEAAEQSDIFEWDTGPPGANSFAESVLQRSVLAHAPPSLA